MGDGDGRGLSEVARRLLEKAQAAADQDSSDRDAVWTHGPVSGRDLAAAVQHGALLAREAGGNRLVFRGAPDTPIEVRGSVRLTGLNAPLSLLFEHCRFVGRKFDLSGAEIGQLRFEQCELADVEMSDLGTSGLLSLQQCQVNGAVTLMDASIDGMLALEGTQIAGARKRQNRTARITGEDSDLFYALDARNAVIKGSVNLTRSVDDGPRFDATGRVSFRSADIEGHLNMEAARLTGGEARVALDLNGARIGRSVFFFTGAEASGELDLRGAVIDGQLNFRDSQLKSARHAGHPNGGEVALNGNGLQVRRQLILARAQILGDVVLTGAACAELWDAYVDHKDKESRRPWRYPAEGRLQLHGFSFDRIHRDSVVPVSERLAWLRPAARRGEDDGFSPQPYTQFGNVLHAMGHDDQARRVFMEREGLRRRNAGPLRQFGGQLYAWVVGCGYQPWRGVMWMLALVGAGAFMFANYAREGHLVPSAPYLLYQLDGGERRLPAGYACPSPWVYSLDVALPIVDLKQEHDWKVSPDPVPGLCTDSYVLPPIARTRLQAAWEWTGGLAAPYLAHLPDLPDPVGAGLRAASEALAAWRFWPRVWFWFQTLAGAMLVALTGLSFSGILKRD